MPRGDHVPVLLQEAVAALAVKPDGIYLDCTFGRGGHALRILETLGRRGRLIALDRDPSAEATARAWTDPRFTFHRAWFSTLSEALEREGVDRVDGALLDLGIASPQIDEPERGFSFRADGPLDMRMDPARGQSAAQWLATASETELKGVIENYGEERFAQQIARAIVAARAHEPIVRTRQLAAIVAKALGARARGDRSQDPATRTFQAVRIHVNQELQELPLTLDALLPYLASGARLAVISFHSLEDRLVKQFLRRRSTPFEGDARLARLAIASNALPQPPLKLVGRAVRAGNAEVAANPRARSATLRVAERTEAALT
ncbi:MAG: 16S rRNA (cytosine(1402)-N(4))-methyltransferase RsmH [Pseudomonadota bacterium]|nr:16S rRNA (cytosine(1402)-N(4))-methyltransferase RsmH [Pseudomonadota bacterium]